MSSEECSLALKAAVELLQEKCGLKLEEAPKVKTIELFGLRATVPVEVETVASSNSELTSAERIKAVSESDWARGWAEGMLNLVNPQLAGAAREEALKNLAERLAREVV